VAIAAAAAEDRRMAVAVDCRSIVADRNYSLADTAVEQVDSILVWDCCTLGMMSTVGTEMVIGKQRRAVAVEDSIALSNVDETNE
jgi:hypothetical protein